MLLSLHTGELLEAIAIGIGFTFNETLIEVSFVLHSPETITLKLDPESDIDKFNIVSLEEFAPSICELLVKFTKPFLH